MGVRRQRRSARPVHVLTPGSLSLHPIIPLGICRSMRPRSETPEACPTIDEKCLPCDVGSAGAGEEGNRSGDFAGVSEAPHRNSGQIPRLSFAALRVVGTKQLRLGMLAIFSRT